MTQAKAVIADDENQLRVHLKSLLLELWPELVICGEARNGQEALELIERHRPDIVGLSLSQPMISMRLRPLKTRLLITY
jgi:DNA-binding NarL/FixJ family response regulator